MATKAKKEKVLISVIVTVYNTSDCLFNCLNSLCKQTLKEIEIICVDDGSTDNSADILKKYQEKDSRIKIITQKNQGLSSARNAGLEVATGEYIAFVDSDDVISPNMYEYLYSKIIKYNTDIVVCNHFLMNENNVHIRSMRGDFFINSEKIYLFELLLGDNIFDFVWSRLYKKELFDNVRFRVGKVFEDVYLSADLFDKINSAFYTSEPLYCYRIRNDGITGSKKISNIEDAIDGVYLRYNMIKEKYPELQNINVYSLFKWYCNMLDDFGNDKIDAFFKKFKDKIVDVINDFDKADISIFCNNYKYNEVLAFVTEFNNWLKKNSI